MTVFVVDARFTTPITELRMEIFGNDFSATGSASTSFLRPAHLADGGGGYGDPFEREPERLQVDVIDGYVNRAAAERDYGVTPTDTLEIDWAATKRARNAPRTPAPEPKIKHPPPKDQRRR
jgi:hypothetical protein